MSREARIITKADILPLEAYVGMRAGLRKQAIATRRHRRLELGPWLTLYFENYDTMWRQVHEMMFVERAAGGDVEDELDAYNPLIPQGHELVATMLAEITDAAKREAILVSMLGVKRRFYIDVDGIRVWSEPELGPRSAEGVRGRATSVYFLHFPFTEEARAAFTREGAKVVVGVDHPSGAHEVRISAATWASLSTDFV